MNPKKVICDVSGWISVFVVLSAIGEEWHKLRKKNGKVFT